jgi:hypothetical protein
MKGRGKGFFPSEARLSVGPFSALPRQYQQIEAAVDPNIFVYHERKGYFL